jgi:hypothetical protein
MITRDIMMEPILKASPSWREFLTDWQQEDEPPIYLILCDLARHISQLLTEGAESELQAIFGIIED